MTLLLLRVATAPLLILAGSLAQRRFGPSLGGRLVGLPLTSLPLLFLLDLSDGRSFAGRAATASLAAGLAQSAWCVVYAAAARRHRPLGALALATAAFAAGCVLLDLVPLPAVAGLVLSSASILAALAIWPRPGDGPSASRPAGGQLLGRMAAGAVFTLAVTASAASLGARPAGLLGSLPVLTVVLAVATHRRGGGDEVNRFLRGVMAGSGSVVAALAVLALLLPSAGAAVAFPAAVLASLAAQGLPVLGRLVARTGARPATGPGTSPATGSARLAEAG